MQETRSSDQEVGEGCDRSVMRSPTQSRTWSVGGSAILSLLIGAGCGPKPASERPDDYPGSDPEPEARTFGTVSIVGALVAPTKIDGRPWDGMGDPTELVQAVGGLLADASPYVAIAGAMAGPASAALDKPDVGGSAELYMDGRVFGVGVFPKVQDSFSPQWSTVTWDNVELPLARVRLTFWDRDLVEDDPIGIVEVGPDDLVTAASVGNVFPVRVDSQNAQVLFVAISVM
jgi:hypothetical protein